jgi:predicted RNA-binding protein (virulence factor B family)
MGPGNIMPGDELDVFLYHDSQSVLIATTTMPGAQVGECAYLKVVQTTSIGAFLDWGLPKDLLVPVNEQYSRLREGRSYVVYLFLDPQTDRVTASAKLNSYLSEHGPSFKPGQEVDLLVCGTSDMGYKAVIDNTHLGLIHRNEAFQPLTYGQKLKGYIKNIRPDKKIDLTLQAPGRRGKQDLGAAILDHLQAHGGTSGLTDRSSPEEIVREFGVSKSNYKKALGMLYKQQKIVIEKDRIVLKQ